MKLRMFFTMAIAIVFVMSCTAAPRNFTFNNGHFEVLLNDPAAPDLDGALGCRFLRPGWIMALQPTGSRESVFHTRTLYRHHPAFGCAQEILPELELLSKRQLKIGVGIIEPNRVNRFRAKAVELFPWNVITSQTENWFIMTARQNSGNYSGYAYELTVSVIMIKGTPEVVMKQELRNIGSRRIEGRVYLHPFFNVRRPRNSKFMLAGGTAGYVFDMPEFVTEKYRKSDNALKLSAVFWTDRECTVTIAADVPLISGRLWHNGKNCFAVEPFIAVNVAPGEQQKWNWDITIRTAAGTGLPEVFKCNQQVHMYKPGAYTHQRVKVRDGRLKPGEKPIPYPGKIAGTDYDKEELRRDLQPVRDFQKKYGARIYVGEFSAAIWAPGAADYLRDCIELFEEYGWDWTYHAFRESPVWDVEKAGTNRGDIRPAADTDRRRVLLEGFRRNKVN